MPRDHKPLTPERRARFVGAPGEIFEMTDHSEPIPALMGGVLDQLSYAELLAHYDEVAPHAAAALRAEFGES